MGEPKRQRQCVEQYNNSKEKNSNQKRHKHAFKYIFDRVCEESRIEHRLTKVSHPWTNGQVERMNRTLKDATVKKYYYKSHQLLKYHLYDFVMAYNYAKRLKTLNGLTPYEFICTQWTQSPELFILNPLHHTLGPYSFSQFISAKLVKRIEISDSVNALILMLFSWSVLMNLVEIFTNLTINSYK